MSTAGDRDAEGASASGPIDPQETIDVTVLVRPRALAEGAARIEELSALPVEQRHYPSRDEYAAAHGADAADLGAVEAFARAHGLRVKEASAARRSVVLSGPARDVAAAFGVTLRRVDAGGVPAHVPDGPVRLPPELAPIVEAVLGLDDRPHARPHDA
jgi:kumamolisin